ncbi:MAG: hypothetical protein QOA57_07160, partial [Nitrososphaeraceae archaeon]|nr:hypothetical protein [Nitrososphaeraceae archaeon]
MGFLDKIKEAIRGGKEKSDDAKMAAAKTEVRVDESADKAQRAADKAENAVDDTSDASDELKKDQPLNYRSIGLNLICI